ncbi:hypothetical protein CHUAL_003569 [Chamberlinius hualienensis]
MKPYLLIREVGMMPVLIIFHLFGFRPNDKSQRFIKYMILCITVLPFPILFIHNYRYFVRFYRDDENKPAIVAVMVSILYGYISSFVMYIYGHYNFERCRRFMFRLAIAVKRLDPQRRELAVKQIKRYVISGILFYIIYTLIGLQLYVTEIVIRWNPDSGLYFHICQILNVIYLTTVGSFTNWCTPFLMIVCKILILLIDGHVRYTTDVVQPQSVSEHQMAHKYMSNLVREADSVASLFLLISLTSELLTSILCIKCLNADDSGKSTLTQLCIVIYTSGFICLFIIKASCSYQVNEKLLSSLSLRDTPSSFQELEHCSSEHFNYIMYLNGQNASKAELTYGGLFPAQRGFIITIAGTAFTYAVILNDFGKR